MKKLTCLFWVALLLGCSGNLNANVFEKMAAIKFQLETKTLRTPYENILGKNAKEEINTFFKSQNLEVNTDAFFIKIKYIKGLETIQYVEKRVAGNWYYETSFYTPEYEIMLLDSNQVAVFEKKYGKEKVKVDFGKENNYQSSSDLSKDWRKRRKEFYKEKEGNYNNINTFLKDFEIEVLPKFIIEKTEEENIVLDSQIDSIEIEKTLTAKGSEEVEKPIAKIPEVEVSEPSDVTQSIEPVLENDSIMIVKTPPIPEIVEDEITESTSSTEKDSEPIDTTSTIETTEENHSETATSDGDSKLDTIAYLPVIIEEPFDSIDLKQLKNEEPRDLRDHDKIISIGVGLGNLRGDQYSLAQPTFGASLDYYSLDNLLGVDWFFTGGWFGYGKYKYEYRSFIDNTFQEIEVKEIAFVSRYGVSLTRILQDRGIAQKLTQNFDVYALFQVGYSLILVDDFFLGVDSSGGSGGIAVGGRYEWRNFGAYTELGLTETGFAKFGLFLKL